MDYLSSLQCKTEPFVSPSDSEIYLCQAVRDLTEKISHNIHLGTGLQLVIGADGSGKSTLLNQLAQKFSEDNKTAVLMISNPQFRNLQQFLVTVAGIFKTINIPSGFDDNTFQKAFNNFFYKLCQQEKKIVVLLIDNGQNLPDFCLHALNSFYDHHPDCRGFLQTVICGEPSFQRKINANKSLNGRFSLTAALKPFNFTDIRKLIRFHLEQAAVDPGSPPELFSIPAQWVIFRMTLGHPKETIDLCRFIVLTLVIENRKKADWFMTLRSAKLLIPKRAKKLQIIRTTFLSSLIVFMLVLGLWSEEIKALNVFRHGHQLQVTAPKKLQPQETQPVNPLKTIQKTYPPEQNKKAPPKKSTVIKETLLPVVPTEEQVAEMEPAEMSAAVPNQPEVKASTAEVPVPQSAEVVDEEAMSELKPVPEVETIVIPAIRLRREVRPGDTLLGMIQQVYGSEYVKTQYQYIDRVIEANPHLKDPHNLEVGDQVFFPAMYTPEEAKPVVDTTASESPPSTKSVLEQQPVDSPDFIDKRVEPPEYLGDIITAPGETFGDMVRRIYGPWSFNAENIKTVLAVNPNLKNPELLHVGHKILFPTIPVTLTPKAEEVWWVRINTFDNIQNAYRFLRKHRKSPSPLVIIPSRDESGQVLMNILLKDYFMDKESAQKVIQALPGIITAQAEALHGLSPAIFYYRMKQNDQVFFPAVYVQEEAKPLIDTTASESPPSTKSVLEPQPVYSSDFIDKRVEPPEYLGDIITAPGEAFGDMIRRIYGPWSFNSENVKTVLAVNPNFKNPELLHVGHKIRFPTIPVTLTPKAEEVWWVRIITFDNIQSAYRFLRRHRKSPRLVIIPSRDESGQVLMNVLLEKYFVDKESAQKAIQALPGISTAQAEALPGLNPAIFYYRMKQNDLKNNETKKP